VQAGAGQFAFAERQRRGALVHGVGDGFVHKVHDEFVRGTDIARGVFGRAVFAVAGRKRTDRRIRAHEIEEAERRGVHLAVGADGRHQRNRSWRDEAGKNGIRAVGKFFFEIEFHKSNQAEYFRRATYAPSTLSANGSNWRSVSSLKFLFAARNCFITSEFSSGSRLHVL